MARLPKLIGAVALAMALAAAVSPWRVRSGAVARAIGGDLALSSGLDARIGGRVTFKLLPRPRIQATQLSIAAADGAVLVDAPLLKADVDIPSLIGGAWRISSATLVEPTVTVDLDRLAARPAGMPRPEGRPGLILRLRAGVLRTRSSTATADMLATGIDAAAEWPAEGDGLTVSGSATVKGTTVQFAGTLDHPAAVFAPEGATLSVAVESPLFTLAAGGLLSGGTQEQFAGHVALSTPSLPRLVRAFDGPPMLVGARRAQISGDLLAKPRDLSLSNARLRLDRAGFEGTLAWRRDGAHALVAGTLATDLLDLDALLGDGLDRAAIEAFARRPLDPAAFGTDIDMRVSASVARVGRVRFSDAAVAALVRDGRLELTLDEAGAYGGTIKARAVARLGPGGIDAHADLAATRVDLGELSAALGGAERVDGALSGHAALDGRGTSPHDLVAALEGRGQLGIEDGRLAGLSLAQALRRIGRRLPLDGGGRGTPTTFDKALWDLTVDHGTVRIPDGRLTAPGVTMSFGAETALPDGSIVIHAVAAQADATGAPLHGGGRLPLDLSGTWNAPLLSVGHARFVLPPVPVFGAPLP